jgi:hypothetical protein
VAQQIADVPDVRAALEQLGRVAVPEHVRMHVDAEPPSNASHCPRDRSIGDRPPGRRDEQRRV